MKKKLTNNLGLKILSLVIAFLMWLIIVNIEDPAITGTFEGIPVEVINEEALESEEKAYDVIGGDVVDIEVKGKRSIIEKLGRSSFKATADLSQLSIVNAVEINVSVPGYLDEVEITHQSVSTMKVSLEDVVTEQFRVDIIERGSLAEGYYINEKTARPNIMQVRGAESIINKIKEVNVFVDITNANESFNITSTPQIYDHNGTLMDPEKMELSYEEFDITVNVLKTKTVKLFLELVGEPARGFTYVAFEYEPKEVEIAGTEDELAKVPNIKGSYNINYARADIEDEVNISDFIKNDVILIDENQNAVINIDIEPLENKEITFNTVGVDVRNLPENKTLEYDNPGPFIVTASGLAEELAKVSRSNLSPYIDLKDLEGNSGEVLVLFDYAEEGISFSDVKLEVSLKGKD